MPNKPLKISRPWVQEREAFGRRKDNSKFYNSRKWRKFATAYREKHPYCVKCDDEGLVGPANVCDHIRGLDWLIEQGLNPIAEEEVQSLCHHCHNKKSGKESHGNREKLKK